MWKIYTRYALPFLVLTIVFISIIRASREYKQNDDPKKRTKMLKKVAVSATISLLLLSIIIITILS